MRFLCSSFFLISSSFLFFSSSISLCLSFFSFSLPKTIFFLSSGVLYKPIPCKKSAVREVLCSQSFLLPQAFLPYLICFQPFPFFLSLFYLRCAELELFLCA